MRFAAVKHGRETVRDIVSFGGLNRTDDVRDGELAECENLSTRRYPYLAPRGERTVEATYAGASAYYCFDGHTVVCANGRLLFDGTDVCAVEDGEKQFAVVGTKLCVFPDKLMLDVQSGETEPMSTLLTTDGGAGSAVFTASTLTAAYGSATQSDTITWENVRSDLKFFYYYTCTEQELCNAWDGTQWNLASLEEYKRYDAAVSRYDSLPCYTILKEDGTLACGAHDEGDAIVAQFNRSGKYGQITYSVYAQNLKTVTYYVKRATGQRHLADLYRVGDAVDVAGTKYGIYDRTALRISAIDDATNCLTFAGEPFTPVTHACVPASDLPRGEHVVACGETNYSFTSTQRHAAGGVLCKLANEIGVWQPDGDFGGAWVAKYACTQTSAAPSLTLAAFDAGEGSVISVRRAIPDLAFICEHQNRLWGVANAQDNVVYDERAQTLRHVTSRVIFASALGEPTRFYSFDGTATDSYQVAVGGEGDFTAICSYGGAVCCFKERKLHKVLGGYPAEFYLSSRDLAGVQSSSAKSLALLGGALYYKGVGGVYRFTGGAAECVSKKLGELPDVAVGGTDGRRYYLSTEAGLFVFDAQTNMWLREDDLRVTDFAFADGLLLLAGDTVYRVGDATSADVAFSATLAPFSEHAFARKRYAKLSLEATLGAGAYLTVEAQADGGAWRTVGTLAAGTAGVRVMHLAPMRCGSLALRLRGKGDVTVSALRRRFEARSERE